LTWRQIFSLIAFYKMQRNIPFTLSSDRVLAFNKRSQYPRRIEAAILQSWYPEVNPNQTPHINALKQRATLYCTRI
jgi:hypothetical protein